MKESVGDGYRGTGGDGQVEANGDWGNAQGRLSKDRQRCLNLLRGCISITILTTLSKFCPLVTTLECSTSAAAHHVQLS